MHRLTAAPPGSSAVTDGGAPTSPQSTITEDRGASHRSRDDARCHVPASRVPRFGLADVLAFGAFAFCCVVVLIVLCAMTWAGS